jgi:hypothetical protein
VIDLRPGLTALLIGAGILLAGCGGSSGSVVSTPGPVATHAVQRVTHANPVTLLPTAGQVAPVIKPASRPSRYDETLSPSNLGSAFANQVPRAMSQASGTAQLSVVGRHGTFLYAHVFVFRALANAESLAGAFLHSTRLASTLSAPSGAPGQPATASSQPYGDRQQISYRYAFRDGNVLAYVELDGPRQRYSLAQAISVAAALDQHIQAAAGG